MSALDSGHYGPADDASNEAALGRGGEAVDLCSDETAAGVSVAQVARHYALNANLIFRWLRDPRFAPDPDASPTEGSPFLPVEVERAVGEDAAAWGDTRDPGCTIEIDLAGGHRMRINGRYDPEALARLIRGLSG